MGGNYWSFHVVISYSVYLHDNRQEENDEAGNDEVGNDEDDNLVEDNDDTMEGNAN